MKSAGAEAFRRQVLRGRAGLTTSEGVPTNRQTRLARLTACAALLLFACVSCADAHAASHPAAPARLSQKPGDVSISRIMVDPTTVSDELGEWIKLTNNSASAVDLRGWRLASGRDPGYTIPTSLRIRPHTAVILGRSADLTANGGVRVVHEYSGITLANGADWLSLANPAGVTVDSVAWDRAPRGSAIEHNAGVAVPPQGDTSAAPSRPTRPSRPPSEAPPPAVAPTVPQTPPSRELVVRILDVGQGDAILIQNGGSTVLVDGGPLPPRSVATSTSSASMERRSTPSCSRTPTPTTTRGSASSSHRAGT